MYDTSCVRTTHTLVRYIRMIGGGGWPTPEVRQALSLSFALSNVSDTAAHLRNAPPARAGRSQLYRQGFSPIEMEWHNYAAGPAAQGNKNQAAAAVSRKHDGAGASLLTSACALTDTPLTLRLSFAVDGGGVRASIITTPHPTVH